jgi:glycosyltransferase involved in cell wall biosynthesis
VDTHAYAPGSGGSGAIVIGRLTSQKRVELAIDAVAHLRSLGRDLPLTIVGDGPARAELERRAQQTAVAGLVTFTGAVAPTEIPRWLARADVMLFPARREGFGLVAAEALMSGVPVVACKDGGGVLDVVPAGGPGRRAQASAAAIAEAATELLNDDARAAARADGEVWRKYLAPEMVAEVCEGWYAEALGA